MWCRNRGGNILFRNSEGNPQTLNTGEEGDVPEGVFWKHQDKLQQIPNPTVGHTIDEAEELQEALLSGEGGGAPEDTGGGNSSIQAPEVLVAPHGYRRFTKAALIEWMVGNLGAIEADLAVKTKADLIAQIEAAIPGAAAQ